MIKIYRRSKKILPIPPKVDRPNDLTLDDVILAGFRGLCYMHDYENRGRAMMGLPPIPDSIIRFKEEDIASVLIRNGGRR